MADRPESSLLPMVVILALMLAEMRGEGRATTDFAQAWHLQNVVEAAKKPTRTRRWIELHAAGDGIQFNN